MGQPSFLLLISAVLTSALPHSCSLILISRKEEGLLSVCAPNVYWKFTVNFTVTSLFYNQKDIENYSCVGVAQWPISVLDVELTE